MFVDHASIHCYAGSGGKGCNSFIRSRHLKHPKPNGGDGGQGGSIYLKASKDTHTLLDVKLKKTFKADSGKHGGRNHMNGAVGKDLTLKVPIGTEVYDESTGHLLKDLCHEGDVVCAAVGGEGGKGNHRHAESMPGDLGEEKIIRLELKLIADVGLVGFPNAGKSTLISHLSNAKSRIAPFPFTTKEPVLGVVQTGYGDSFVIADIPGLIEGAHTGRGLGHRFLRHVERTRMFLHIIDMASIDGRDPVEDYYIIKKELMNYSKDFAGKPFLIVANKMDIPEADEQFEKFKTAINENILPISAVTGDGLKELREELWKQLSVLDGNQAKL